jgi:threonine/homoserine/homoserine lactone efflux protein
MPHIANLFTYIAVVTIFVIIPGPSVLLTIAKSISAGTRSGLMTAIGIAAGDIIHTTLAILGVSAILMASALAFSIMKYIGALYLVYLGVKALLHRNDEPQLNVMTQVDGQKTFIQGFLCEVLNPKSALFFLAFLPQFVDSSVGSPHIQLAIFGLTFVALGAIATCSYALVASNLGAFLKKRSSFVKWQNKFVGILYCSLGLRLAFMSR